MMPEATGLDVIFLDEMVSYSNCISTNACVLCKTPFVLRLFNMFYAH